MKRIVSILAIFIFSLSISIGQVLDVTNLYPGNKYFFPEFEYVGEDAGFTQQRINCMHEDHLGYVWIGTVEGGLFRYDGYIFKRYQSDISDPYTMLGNEVFFIFEDSRNILWVGTDLALCKYNRELDRFQKISLALPDNSATTETRFTALTEDKDKNLVVAINSDLMVLPDTTISRLSTQHEPVISLHALPYSMYKTISTNRNISESKNLIYDLRYDAFGNLWGVVANNIGKFILKAPRQFHDSTVKNKPGVADFKPIAEERMVRQLYQDESGIIWASSRGQLIKIMPQKDTSRVEIIPCKGNTRSITDFKNHPPNGLKFWVGYIGGNPLLFDTESEFFYPLTFESNKTEKLHNKTLNCFLRTRSGVILTGTAWGGLFKYNPNALRSAFHPGLQQIHLKQVANLRYVFEDSKEHIWIIARDVYRCDKYTGEIQEIFTDDIFGKLKVYKNKMLEDRLGRFWIAMEGQGLNFLDISEGSDMPDSKSATVVSKKVIENTDITALYEDNHGNIWAANIGFDQKANSNYSGLYKVDPDGRVLKSYIIHLWPVDNQRAMNQFINQIHMDNTGMLWMATGFGLVKFDPETELTTVFNYPQKSSIGKITAYRITTLCPDPKYPEKYLWLGTAGGGLVCFDKQNQTFTPAKDQDGNPGRTISSLLSDDYGNLWIAATKGIIRASIIASGGRIAKLTLFDKASGLFTNDYSNFYGHNAVKTKSGDLIFTGPKGFQIINPADAPGENYIPPVYITGLRVNQQDADYGQQDSPLDQPLSKVEKIHLPYDENTLTFELTAPDYQSSAHIIYAYKLEGFNNDWVSNGSQRTVTFTNLPPGSYNLKVKVGNRYGAWGVPSKGLAVQIMQPWWWSRTAIVLYILLSAAVVWLMTRFRLKREQMKLDIKINRMEADKYKELDALKSKFFANISHEFRTPLTLILNPVDELLAEAQTNKFIKPLKMVQQNAKKLQSYINDILELTKLEAGRLTLSRKSFDIVAYTKFLAAPFESLARHKKIALHISSTEAQIICSLDPEKYNTIFTNLFSNAIKFTPKKGRIDVEISICGFERHQQCQLEKGCTILSVKNSGPGIPADKLPHVFDRYYRAEHDSSQSDAGTGIGLALVKELVNLHKGDIDAKSKVGEFTEFIVRFPKESNCPESAENLDYLDFEAEEDFIFQAISPDRHQMDGQDEIKDKDKKIVLVIEDNVGMRTILLSGLKKEYQVIEAHDGEEGILKAIETIPDLIISDVMMPKKDGYEVSLSLKTNELTSHIPIILLTARADMQAKLEGLQTGADDYLVKPFYSKELKVRVRNLLELREKLKLKYSRQVLVMPDEDKDKTIEQTFLEKVQQIVIKNMADDKFDVNLLTELLGISRTQLNRKLKALTNKSANELIRYMRMEKANDLLRNKQASISEIAFMVGFKNPPYFTKVFKSHFGHNPSEHADIAGRE